MARIYRMSSAFFAVASALLFGYGLATLVGNPPVSEGGGKSLLDSHAESFGEMPSGRAFSVGFPLTNRGSRTIKFVGSTYA